MKTLLWLPFLLALPAGAQAQDDERLARILERIEREIRASHTRLREEIRELIRAELAPRSAEKPAPRPAPAPAPVPLKRKATLGITAGDLSDQERKAAGIGGGLKVEEVRGPAEKAGLKPGDILVELDGEAVTEERIGDILSRHQPGDTVAVVVIRGKKRETLKLTLGERRD